MKDENGKEMTEKEKIKDVLELLAEALCVAYETETPQGHALAIMIDCALKYGEVVYRDDDVLRANADFNAYENEIFQKKEAENKKKKLKVIK